MIGIPSGLYATGAFVGTVTIVLVIHLVRGVRAVRRHRFRRWARLAKAYGNELTVPPPFDPKLARQNWRYQ